MKIVIDIPDGMYANLADIQFGSIASKVILNKVKNGKPYEERPQGGWIFDEYTRKEDKKYAPNGFYLCSVCCNKQFEKSNYCPNCGADMRGERR